MERLTPEQIADMKEYFSRSKEVKASSLAIKLSHDGLKLIDIIEAQQQENNGWRERYDELDAGHSRLFKDFCKLQQENEQLRARVARMREACILGYSYLSLIFHRADIKNWNEVGMCSVKDIKHVLNELESAYKGGNTPADYHNPADVEALRKAREAIKAAWGDGSANAAMDKAREALAEIDKVIGGKEDV